MLRRRPILPHGADHATFHESAADLLNVMLKHSAKASPVAIVSMIRIRSMLAFALAVVITSRFRRVLFIARPSSCQLDFRGNSTCTMDLTLVQAQRLLLCRLEWPRRVPDLPRGRGSGGRL